MADWLTVKDAAEVLGISQDAVRKRIARGRIEARQQDKTWLVLVDQDTTEQDTAEPKQARQPQQRQARDREIEELLRARITELEATNGQLWAERREAAAEKERLSQTLQQQAAIIARLVALPATAGPSAGGEPLNQEHRDDEDTPKEEQPKRRRGFWERIFNP